ncbi:hypothetical protein ACFQ48_19385 [Hymenobacter caeli]|uniref:Acyl CoA:acetate/3-ketoacid CoA transferase alpha subunit n=1 Tax=Hymenobacter caeli TaxID=2735894 RepID=A0ABX2FWG7_9BACT|nr:hypothetical protein [Hymenobacter caeli]NRT21123.1 acyl CoA:acetate/3-ketoacid CoA transferase alpha subunit [Hymenobacter caeli]
MGKPYPHPNPYPGQNGARAQLTDSFITILCCLNQPSAQEISLWRTGSIRYGLHEVAPGLPFILTDLGQGWLFDVTLNLRRPGTPEAEAVALVWPQQMGQRLVYVLLDATTNIVHGWQSFQAAPAFVQAVRAAAARQLSIFDNEQQIAASLAKGELIPLQQMQASVHFYG